MSRYNSIVVVQLSKDGRFIARFPSIVDAARFVFKGNVKAATIGISRCVHGQYRSYKGFLWKKYNN